MPGLGLHVAEGVLPMDACNGPWVLGAHWWHALWAGEWILGGAGSVCKAETCWFPCAKAGEVALGGCMCVPLWVGGVGVGWGRMASPLVVCGLCAPCAERGGVGVLPWLR